MSDLEKFKQKVTEYRDQARIFDSGRKASQEDLANAINLNKGDLSRRFNGHRPFSHDEIRRIVKVLADWSAINTRQQAHELLNLMECDDFSPAEWTAFPLENLLDKSPKVETEKGSFKQPISLKEQVQTYLRGVYNEIAQLEGTAPQESVQLRKKPSIHQPKNTNSGFGKLIDRMRQQNVITTRYAEPFKGYHEPDPNQEIVNLEEYLTDKKQIVLSGEPGAGKSTTLHGFFRSYGNFWLRPPTSSNDLVGLIPTFVQLNRWNNPEMDLVSFLQENVKQYSAELANEIPNLLEQGNLLLLLDGLNEIPNLKKENKKNNNEDKNDNKPKKEDKRLPSIIELKEKYDAKCVISCRVKDLDQLLSWNCLIILPLERAEIVQIAAAYYKDFGVFNSNQLAEQLAVELFDITNIQNLKLKDHARNPFYLRYLIAYFYGEKRMPKNPAKLIEFSVNDTLKREYILDLEQEQIVSMDKLRNQLALLAYNMTDAGKVGWVNIKQATAWLFHLRNRDKDKKYRNENYSPFLYSDPQEPEAEQNDLEQAEHIWRLAERASLLIVNENEISFYHQLMQEYFCALYCQQHLPTANSDWFDRIAADVSGEVWFLWKGLNEELTENFLELLKNEDKDIRSGAVKVLGKLKDPKSVQPLLDLLITDREIQLDIIKTLGDIGDARAFSYLIKLLKYPLTDIRQATVISLGQLKDPRAIEPLISALRTCSSELRGKIQPVLVSFGNEIVPALIEALKHPNANVRFSAVQILAATTNYDEFSFLQVIDHLLTVGLNLDEAPYIRLEAINLAREIIPEEDLEKFEEMLMDKDFDFFENEYQVHWQKVYEAMAADHAEMYYEGLKDDGYR